jgi:hypothetical protein
MAAKKKAKKNVATGTKKLLRVLRWATVDDTYGVCIWPSELDARCNAEGAERVVKVRITEVTK